MNKKFLTPILILSLMAIGFAGCMDDNTSALPEGTEFDFGAAVEFNRTRTYYDPEDVANPAATSWKIFWNYEAPLDHIYVYSRQGATGCNQASYTVKAEKNMSAPAPVTKDGSTGVQFGTESDYDFYAMYPASAVTAGSGSGTELSATMPIKQTASTTEKMTTEPVGELQTAADMNCALMIAKVNGYTPTTENGGKVQLQFEPFATMLDITVNGTDVNTQKTVRITSVIIEANAPIAGDFTYDYNGIRKISFGANASNSISIETMFADADGNKVGVMMGNGSTLKVRAFMIPNPAVTSLRVKVVTADSRIMTKTLSMGNFEEKQIHFVKLPKIDVDNLKFDYSIWLSQLDPDIYISEISMPGSALSFNYVMSDGDVKKTQTLNVTEQFREGVRVFQCHVNIIEQTSLLDSGPTSVGIADSEGHEIPKNDGSGKNWTLGDMIEVLRTEMAGIHRDEFCVLSISDWIANVTSSKVSALYSRLKVVLEEAGKKGVVATGINPNTTIDDIKGKIIIKVQLNGRYTDAWRELTGANVWMNIFENEAETSVFYSPMPFATLPGIYDGGTLAGTMNIIYSDNANPVENNMCKTGVRDNATAVLVAYANNYSSIEHKNFSMTYLGGCGADSYYPSDVAKELNSLWLANKNRPAKKPWGWVMFNRVGTEETTTQGIRDVIEHNASPDFKLARRSVAKTQPSGDTQGTTNGGSLFY